MAALQMRKGGPKVSLADNNIDIDKLISENEDKIVEIPRDELVGFKYKGAVQPFGVRESEVAVLAESISTYGQLTPCAVRPYKDKYQVISGHKRLRAAEKLGLEKLKCVIFECDDKTAFELVKHFNVQRDKPKPSEIMQLVAQSKEKNKETDTDGELTVSEIAELYGVSRKHIYRCYSLRNLPASIHAAVDDERIGTNDIEKIINNVPAEHLSEFSEWVSYESGKISSGKLNKVYEWSARCSAGSDNEFTVDSINHWLTNYKAIKEEETAEAEGEKSETERDYFKKLRTLHPNLSQMADSEIFSLIDKLLTEHSKGE